MADLADRLRTAGCVFAEEEAGLLLSSTADAGVLEGRVRRRLGGEPLEQILGWAEFAGLRIAVEPGVFVPRRRTELLVDLAEAHLAGRPAPVVIDLCCGSGAAGAALEARRPVELYAVDLDPVAVRCARRNVRYPHRVLEGDLYEPLPAGLRGRVAVLLANAPYVPSAGIALMPAEARQHEPRLALDGGADGLDLHRRIAAAARDWLAPGGVLLIEVAEAQVQAALAMMAAAGLSTGVHRDEGRDAVAVRATTTGSTTTGKDQPLPATSDG